MSPGRILWLPHIAREQGIRVFSHVRRGGGVLAGRGYRGRLMGRRRYSIYVPTVCPPYPGDPNEEENLILSNLGVDVLRDILPDEHRRNRPGDEPSSCVRQTAITSA